MGYGEIIALISGLKAMSFYSEILFKRAFYLILNKIFLTRLGVDRVKPWN